MWSMPTAMQAVKTPLSTDARVLRGAVEVLLATGVDALPLESFAASARSLRSFPQIAGLFFFSQEAFCLQVVDSLIRGDIKGSLGRAG